MLLPVATDGDGDCLVILGEAVAQAAEQPTTSAAPVAKGSELDSAAETYASHRGVSPGGVGHPLVPKAARREFRTRAAALPREYAPAVVGKGTAAGGGEPGAQPQGRRADAGCVRGPPRHVRPAGKAGGSGNGSCGSCLWVCVGPSCLRVPSHMTNHQSTKVMALHLGL